MIYHPFVFRLLGMRQRQGLRRQLKKTRRLQKNWLSCQFKNRQSTVRAQRVFQDRGQHSIDSEYYKFIQHLIHMEKQENHWDPRFYYIEILSLQIFHQQIDNKVIQVEFILGSKRSSTQFNDKQFLQQRDLKSYVLCDQPVADKQIHIFKYGGQQFLNIWLAIHDEKIGYSRLLLPPICQNPHTKHTVEIDIYQNIFPSSGSEKKPKICSKLKMNIFFQYNFQGTLQLIPISAKLQRNIASVGEMKPKVKFTFEDETWTSLQADGGIRPHWTGHFFASRQKQTGIISTIQQNLKISRLQQNIRLIIRSQKNISTNKQKDQLANIKQSKHYIDCTAFKMKSAGSYLKIQILSDPLIGNTPELIGQTTVRISNEGFLKFPRTQDCKFEQKQLTLTYTSQGITQHAGSLKIYFRFVFDTKKIIKQQSSQFTVEI